MRNRCPIQFQKRHQSQDAAGQPSLTWTDVGPVVWADIKHQTGIGAIKGAASQGVPASITAYSFRLRLLDLRHVDPNPGMRIVFDGRPFDIKGVSEDLQDQRYAFVVAELGGNAG
jgi:head-tail adaptor